MYHEMYLLLFQAITNALEKIEKRNYGEAEDLLRNAQIKAEERYMQGEN